jgi:hypothetical protein
MFEALFVIVMSSQRNGRIGKLEEGGSYTSDQLVPGFASLRSSGCAIIVVPAQIDTSKSCRHLPELMPGIGDYYCSRSGLLKMFPSSATVQLSIADVNAWVF